MIHKTTAILVMVCLSFSAAAQSDSTSQNKTIDQYLSFQGNLLIRQVFNFSNNTIPVNVPYLLNYSLVTGPSKIGFNAGMGYTFNQIKGGDKTNERKTDVNDLFFRVGFEKKKYLNKKWLLGFGGDVLIDRQNDETTNTISFGNSGKVVTTTTSSANGLGFGPRVTLSYAINKWIFIGTEANYYFKKFKSKNEVVTATTQLEFDPITGTQRNVTHTERTKSDDTSKNFQLNLPTVFWITVRF